jgi:predicted DNA-binding transcriptional regulator AlpA
MEILTVEEVATLLKVSKWHVYELAKPRTKTGDVRNNTLPCVRLGNCVRFRKSDVEQWVERLSRLNGVSRARR